MKLFDIMPKENKFSCIYKWTNLIDGKVYIGQTVDFGMRMQRYKGWNFNPYMEHAINKYGVDNFDITILERDLEYDKLDEREQYWMDFYQSYEQDKGYNICRYAGSNRGQVAWNKGLPISDETREKISNGLFKYYSEHEVWNKGIPLKEETKQKLSEILSGKGNPMYGKHHSKETVQKIKDALTGRKMPENQRLKKCKKPVRCVETRKEYPSAMDACKEFNCSYTAIWLCCVGKNKTAKGFHWEYI